MNARQLLQDLLRGDGNDCCDEIVTLARENYPSCTDLVDELLQNDQIVFVVISCLLVGPTTSLWLV